MAEDPKKLTRAHKIALGIISAACCCLIGISAFALAYARRAEPRQSSRSYATGKLRFNRLRQRRSARRPIGRSGRPRRQHPERKQQHVGQPEQKPENESSTQAAPAIKQALPTTPRPTEQTGNGSSQSTTASSTASSTVTGSVSVSSRWLHGRVSGSAHPTFKKGATAYDALCATGLSVSTKSSQYGLYVSAIGGLAEFEYGGKSGWMYSVNGSAPNVSCGKYMLKGTPFPGTTLSK